MSPPARTLDIDVRMRTDPIRAQMLALADMYEQAAAAMRAGVDQLDRLESRTCD